MEAGQRTPSSRTIMKRIIGFLLLAATGVAGASTMVAGPKGYPVASSTASGWQVRTALYAWATALDGDVTLLGNTASADASFEEILDQLDAAFMGALEISNGQWGILSDVFYAELSTGNAWGNRSFDVELSQFIGNFVITRKLVDRAKTRLNAYAGARVNALDVAVNIQTNFIGTFSGSGNRSWVDPLIGMRLERELSDVFFLRMVGDVGGFGVASDVTWQALAGVGCQLGESSSVMLGYRGIGTDYEDGSFAYDVISHGLLLGYECKF